MTNTSSDTALFARCHEEISRAVSSLIFDEPFFGHLIGGLNRRVTTTVATAAVGLEAGRVTLFVNPDFFIRTITRKPERVAIIKHEVLHVLFKHILRANWERIDRQIFNLAADLVVNQFIGAKWHLPDSAITLNSFPLLQLPPDQTVEWYYERLLATAVELNGCGGSHFWGVANDADRALADHELGRMIRDARNRSPRGYALLPDPLKQLVDAAIEQLEPTVDWRRVLRMFSNSSRRSSLKNTLRRPSKRYGTYPGIKIRRFCRLAVAIDTSGSISDDDLSDFFAELRGMWRQGAEITVIECDQMVQNVWEYKGGPSPSAIGGRGGTSFDPVFRWIQEQPRPFDGLIYLTDGYAAAPTERPRCKTLWVLTPDGIETALKFGSIAKIKR